jgi:polysaccharide pyruvyl transferase WcaK-like protein
MKPDFIQNPPIRRFGLVSPWAGGNLGNSAILAAVISNITKRMPKVEVVAITLNCEQVRLRFGIEGFPLASASRYDFSHCPAAGSGRSVSRPSLSGRIRRWIKRVPLVKRCVKIWRTWQHEIAHIAAAARQVQTLDGVIVPGGGALDEFWGGPWGHPWSLLKWSVVSRIYRVPFFVVSVGKCSLKRPLSRWFVRIALKLATYRSYRDPDSKEGVQALIDTARDPVLPDLAFSYPAPVVRKLPVVEPGNRPLLIGVSPIAYLDPRVWPIKDERRYRAYVRQFAELVKWLLNEGHRLLFFATDSPDVATITDVLGAMGDTPKQPDAIRTLLGPIEQNIDNHLEEIGQTDLTIASRLHGVILSHLVATPVLAISYDPKVDAQMRIAKQTDYCLNIDDLRLDRFVERFEALKGTRLQEARHLLSDALLFRQQLDWQYDHILGLRHRAVNEALPESRKTAVAINL